MNQNNKMLIQHQQQTNNKINKYKSQIYKMQIQKKINMYKIKNMRTNK